MYGKAFVFFGLTSIPLIETLYPKNFLDVIPKSHFLRYNFMLYCHSILKVSLGSLMCSSLF